MNHARRTAFRVRTVAAAAVLGAALALSGCGFNAQTLQTYTPAHGVNYDSDTVKGRNLLIVSDDKGQGVLSGSFVSTGNDTLKSVTGKALKADGSEAGSLTITGGPVELKKNALAVLTAADSPIRVSSSALKPGLLADLELTFGSGQTKSITVPVLNAADPVYQDVAGLATPSPTAATPSPDATPAG